MYNSVSLITGIPRSGTTLACKLLNSVNNVIALHEPLDPQKIADDNTEAAVKSIHTQLSELKHALIAGLPFEHGDDTKLILDNPIAMQSQNGIRPLVAKRGMLNLPPITEGTRIVIKQNAMFAALAHHLNSEYPIAAIVRNPIDVILSWRAVDLPVNKGRIPGGERFDLALKNTLDSIEHTLERQIAVYNWFLTQYTESALPILKYEDIIRSQGSLLFERLHLTQTSPTPLSFQQRVINASEKQFLEKNASRLEKKLHSAFYSAEDIHERLNHFLLLS